MSSNVRILVVALAAALLVGLAAPQAAAFHHRFQPGGACGEADDSGGANPTATAAIQEHNPAQDLPLPPAGTPANPDSEPVECPAPGK